MLLKLPTAKSDSGTVVKMDVMSLEIRRKFR